MRTMIDRMLWEDEWSQFSIDFVLNDHEDFLYIIGQVVKIG